MTLCWSTAVKVAQRRPGPRPRRHRFVEVDDRLPRRRSTKAGAETPATHPSPDPYTAHVVRSTKAGAETPATHHVAPRMRTILQRSTKAGAETPATLVRLVSDHSHPPTRSTKAGAETPATHHPGEPSDQSRARSTKAGAETPATPLQPQRCPEGCSPLNEGRGRDPGDTGSCVRQPRRGDSPLNEGRGRDPGDTDRPSGMPEPSSSTRAQRRPGPRPRRHSVKPASVARCSLAQRRPGPRPRRHLADASRSPGRPLRSTKAGAETPATPVGGIEEPLHLRRSTKAGAETPATRERPRCQRRWCQPLNEGRGRDPGDTSGSGSCSGWAMLAQRRPGPRPRRHDAGMRS